MSLSLSAPEPDQTFSSASPNAAPAPARAGSHRSDSDSNSNAASDIANNNDEPDADGDSAADESGRERKSESVSDSDSDSDLDSDDAADAFSYSDELNEINEINNDNEVLGHMYDWLGKKLLGFPVFKYSMDRFRAEQEKALPSSLSLSVPVPVPAHVSTSSTKQEEDEDSEEVKPEDAEEHCDAPPRTTATANTNTTPNINVNLNINTNANTNTNTNTNPITDGFSAHVTNDNNNNAVAFKKRKTNNSKRKLSKMYPISSVDDKSNSNLDINRNNNTNVRHNSIITQDEKGEEEEEEEEEERQKQEQTPNAIAADTSLVAAAVPSSAVVIDLPRKRFKSNDSNNNNNNNNNSSTNSPSVSIQELAPQSFQSLSLSHFATVNTNPIISMGINPSVNDLNINMNNAVAAKKRNTTKRKRQSSVDSNSNNNANANGNSITTQALEEEEETAEEEEPQQQKHEECPFGLFERMPVVLVQEIFEYAVRFTFDRFVLRLMMVCQDWHRICLLENKPFFKERLWNGVISRLMRRSFDWKHLFEIPETYLALFTSVRLQEFTKQENVEYRQSLKTDGDNHHNVYVDLVCLDTNVPLLIQCCRHLPNLMNIELRGRLCEDLFFAMGMFCKNLALIEFSYIKADADWFGMLCMFNNVPKTLTNVYFECPQWFGSDIDTALFHLSECHSLDSLSMEKCAVGGEGLYHLFKGCPNIRSLSLSRSCYEDGQWQKAFKTLTKTNKVLCILEMNGLDAFDDKCLRYFRDVNACPELQELCAHYCACTESGMAKFKKSRKDIECTGEICEM